ncbi:MAG: DUF692 domain-containing protein [Myxococcaceae bacterium]|nr:DUF692 domain-containing protein [Myxococcaceae bacterium]
MALSGVGIGLRRELADALVKTSRRVDWLELIPENVIAVHGRTEQQLERLAERVGIASHGVALNVAGPTPLPMELLRGIRRLDERYQFPLVSEHLCWSTTSERNFLDLLPVPFTEAFVRHVAARVNVIQDVLGRQMLLENISAYARMPGAELDEGAFTRAVLAETGAGLLLDVNNVFVTATNLGLEPLELLHSLPLESAREIHVAGHHRRHGRLVDSHGAPVADEVLALYAEALRRTGPLPTLLEWDTDIPALDVVLDEADRVRAVLDEATRDLSSAGVAA